MIPALHRYHLHLAWISIALPGCGHTTFFLGHLVPGWEEGREGRKKEEKKEGRKEGRTDQNLLHIQTSLLFTLTQAIVMVIDPWVITYLHLFHLVLLCW